MKINHRNLELEIGQPCHCDDYLQLKVAGYYSTNNKIVIASRRDSKDQFFIAARGPKTDLSEAILLDSRYLVIGDINDVDDRILSTCALQNSTDTWMELPQDIFTSRLLIAGAVRIITVTSALSPRLAQTPEYRQALIDRRVIELVC